MLRGYAIEFNGTEWVYSDTGESTVKTWMLRPCGHCGLHNTPEGHDGCLGTLPGLMNACCGHGTTRDAYIQFEDESCLRGEEAINWMQEHGGGVLNMERKWIDINGSIEINVEEETFNKEFLRWLESKGWLFVGGTTPAEDNASSTEEDE